MRALPRLITLLNLVAAIAAMYAAFLWSPIAGWAATSLCALIVANALQLELQAARPPLSAHMAARDELCERRGGPPHRAG